MSLFAGAFARRKDGVLPPDVTASIKAAISRHPSDQPATFSGRRFFVAQVDLKAFGTQSVLSTEQGDFTVIAGEALLTDDSSRSSDIETVAAALQSGNTSVLARSRGAFAVAHYDEVAGRLTLATDKLGVRSLYVWMNDDFVVFATALRILEEIPLVPKVMDVRAVTEASVLKYSLGPRTPYFGVRSLLGSEFISVDASSSTAQLYWHWDSITQSTSTEEELLQRAYVEFLNAIRRRTRYETTAAAFLSGGLDSRCVVAGLRNVGLNVHTFNFSVPGSQDRVFGAQFAEQVGTFHHEAHMIAPGQLAFFELMRETWEKSEARKQHPAERPASVWSGDGGSVGLGHVFMSQSAVKALRDGDLESAIRSFLDERRLSVVERLLNPSIVEVLSPVLRNALREEMQRVNPQDPGRKLYLFLMNNDQRRHLCNHFENMDLHRLELQLPFFDSDFLELVMSIPLDLCMRHAFYTKWLERFGSDTYSVPWQSYPGHVPCPHPVPQNLAYQWNDRDVSELKEKRRKDLLRSATGIVREFPSPLLNKFYLRFASEVFRFGIRDYGYVLDSASVFHRYWVVCGGRYELPTAG